MEESFSALCDMLPDSTLPEQARQRFTAPHRRLEWLSVRVLLHGLLGEEKEIGYLPSGEALSGRRFLSYQYLAYQRICSCYSR